MNRIYDCFLYNDERELLSIRLQLLADVVHKFVIVWSGETFTGLKKREAFPPDLMKWPQLEGRIELIELATLSGNSAWEKEAFSRNALVRGVADASPSDLIMVSDVDEIPRPSVLSELAREGEREFPIVLEQDYFNFKFNYRLIHGLQAVWAGPVLCRFQDFTSAQQLREKRWELLENPGSCIEDAGWHFSFLAPTDDISYKLSSFSHQERSIQSRREKKVGFLITDRQGFHDHVHPGSIWAVVQPTSLGCINLERLILGFPDLVVSDKVDDRQRIDRAIRHSVRRLCHFERSKILNYYSLRELWVEVVQRLRRRIFGGFLKAP